MYLRCDWWLVDKSMRLILHSCCQMLGTISGLRCVKSGPSQIEYYYSSSYAAFNNQLNVYPRRNNPHFLPNEGQNIRITLCQLRSRSNPVYLQFLIFRLQYSIERIFDDIGDMLTIQCALYSTFAAKCRPYPEDYAMSTLVPVNSNRITVLPMETSIFNWTYLQCDW
jgi:hypothetical protein